jgi:hypothetical protein
MTVRNATYWSNKAEAKGTAGPRKNQSRCFRFSLSLWYIQLRWAFIAASLVALAIERIAQPDFLRPQQIVLGLAWPCSTSSGWVRTRADRRQAGGAHLWHRRARCSVRPRPDCNRPACPDPIAASPADTKSLAIFYVFHMALGSLLLPTRHVLLEVSGRLPLRGGGWANWRA